MDRVLKNASNYGKMTTQIQSFASNYGKMTTKCFSTKCFKLRKITEICYCQFFQKGFQWVSFFLRASVHWLRISQFTILLWPENISGFKVNYVLMFLICYPLKRESTHPFFLSFFLTFSPYSLFFIGRKWLFSNWSLFLSDDPTLPNSLFYSLILNTINSTVLFLCH